MATAFPNIFQYNERRDCTYSGDGIVETERGIHFSFTVQKIILY